MLPPLRPRRLHPGDRVAVLTPASPSPADELEAGLERLDEFALQVNVAPLEVDPRFAYLAGSDDYRSSQLNEAFRDSDLKAIFSARGGYGSLRILPRLSYEMLRQTPKILVGFSDLTSLLLACYRHAGIICFHGPTVANLATIDGQSLQCLWKVLSSEEPLTLHFENCECLLPGRATGPVLGGNLTTISHLVGSRFLPSFNGAILLLEDRGESLYRVDRMLTQLVHCGLLAGIKGLLLGDFTDCAPPAQILELFDERLAGCSFPVLAGAPVGHGSRNFTLPLGIPATLDAAKATLSYLHTATEP